MGGDPAKCSLATETSLTLLAGTDMTYVELIIFDKISPAVIFPQPEMLLQRNYQKNLG